MRKVVNRCHATGNGSPGEHDQGKKDRWTSAREDQVAGYLEDDVTDEEDYEADGVLV